MNNVYTIEKSHVAATLLKTKSKYFGENFVTIDECNYLKDILIEEYKNQGLTVSIKDEIDDYYFKIYDNVIFLNKSQKISIDDIEDRYRLGVSHFEVLLVLWNEEFIYRSIKNMNKEKIDFIPTDLEEIIGKIINNPSVFYERVTRCLSDREYEYIKELIDNKSCNNCKNVMCNIPTYKKPVSECVNWVNAELIGKVKVLSKK